MKDIVAKRIKSARVMAGLSLRELSNIMEHSVSYNAIAKYEKADKKINALKEEITETLSRYLKVEQFLGIETSFSNPLFNIQIKRRKRC